MKKKRKSFLAMCISGALFGSVAAQGSEIPYDLGTIVVSGSSPSEPTIQINFSPALGGYRWSQTTSGTMGISHSGGSNWNPVCAQLSQSVPDGCTKALANAGLPQPVLLHPWQLIHLRSEIPILDTMSGYIEYALSLCYADIIRDPSECESNYYDAWDYWLGIYAGSDPRAGGALSTLESQHSFAQSERAMLNWTRQWIGGISVYFVSFNTPTTGLTGHNRSLSASRQQRNCEQFIHAWDAHGCSGNPA